MDDELKARLTARETWLRGFHILLFAIIYSVAELVIAAVVVFQFLATLVTGRNNDRLVKFGQSLSTYVYQIMLFFTYNSDAKPYPFGPWPTGAPQTRAMKKKRTQEEPAPGAPDEEPRQPGPE